MIGWKMAPQKYPCQVPGICECYHIWKNSILCVIQLRILRWGDTTELSGWALKAVVSNLISDNQVDIGTERRMWRWNREYCGHKPKNADSNHSWERQGMPAPLDFPEGEQLCWHLDFSSVKLILNIWPPELWGESLKFVSLSV